MANIQHSTLPSSAVHEPKHITINGTSASGKVITNSSTIAGVSEYRFLTENDISEMKVYLQGTDIDASSAFAQYFPCVFEGTVIGFAATPSAAMTTASNTYELQIDGVTVTGSPLTLTTTPGTGGAAGDVVTSTPSSNNVFNTGQALSIVSTSIGNTDANVEVQFVITIQRN